MFTPHVPKPSIIDLRSENVIRRMIRLNRTDVASIQQAARTVYEYDMTKGDPIAKQIYDLLTISISMLVIKGRMLGSEAALGSSATLGVNGLISLALCAEVAKNSTRAAADIEYVEAMIGSIDLSLPQPDQHAYYLLTTLLTAMRDAKSVVDYANGLNLNPKMLGMMMTTFDTVGSSLAELNNDIADEMLAMRRYGVKPAFFKDGIMHAPHQAWVALPPPDGVANVTAILSLAQDTGLADLDYTRGTTPDGRTAYMTDGFKSYLALTLDDKGELVQGISTTAISTRELLERAGKGEYYELFRFMQLLRLYDLIVPYETVAKMPTWPQGPKVSKLPQLAKIFKPTLTPDLIIPRIRALESSGELLKQLEREVEQAESITKERTNSTHRRHTVVGHVRILPPGRRSAPEARQRAWDELGIVLADNETYVRKHKRGSGEEIRSHRARKRKSR